MKKADLFSFRYSKQLRLQTHGEESAVIFVFANLCRRFSRRWPVNVKMDLTAVDVRTRIAS